jgi:hypothetical protein
VREYSGDCWTSPGSRLMRKKEEGGQLTYSQIASESHRQPTQYTMQCALPSCSKAAKRKCAACKSLGYCSREHQRADWKAHKKECKPELFRRLSNW